MALKKAIGSPAYGVRPRSSPGTMQPLDADASPIMPIMASRPLLISARSLVSALPSAGSGGQRVKIRTGRGAESCP